MKYIRHIKTTLNLLIAPLSILLYIDITTINVLYLVLHIIVLLLYLVVNYYFYKSAHPENNELHIPNATPVDVVVDSEV